MTIKQIENIQNFSQQEKLLVFNEKSGKLSDTEETQLLQVSNVQQKLWKTLWHAASHHQLVDDHSQQYVAENPIQNRKLEDKGKYFSEERESDIEHGNEINNTEGGSDHLLILAHSAELMWESDSLDGSHGNDHSNEGFCTTTAAQNSSEGVRHATVTDPKSPGQIEGMSVTDHMRGEKDGFHGGGRTPRLTHIRRQARLPSNLLVQPRLGEYTAGNLQGKRVRLTQIRHQARCKNCLQKYSCRDSQGRIVRLSELRRQARLKPNTLVQKTIEDQVNRHLDCQTSKDNQRNRIITDIFGEEDGSKAGADFHLSEVNCMHEYSVNVGIDQSVPVINEVEDKKILVKGTKWLS